jgi:hypothetical protein
MTADHRHVVRALLALLCAGVLGLIAAVLWVPVHNPSFWTSSIDRATA